MNEPNPVIHDFRSHVVGWGWNILSIYQDKSTKEFHVLGVGKGLKEGHFIARNDSQNEEVGHKIERVEYESNPRDMFNAVISGTYEFEEGELTPVKP